MITDIVRVTWSFLDTIWWRVASYNDSNDTYRVSVSLMYSTVYVSLRHRIAIAYRDSCIMYFPMFPRTALHNSSSVPRSCRCGPGFEIHATSSCSAGARRRHSARECLSECLHPPPPHALLLLVIFIVHLTGTRPTKSYRKPHRSRTSRLVSGLSAGAQRSTSALPTCHLMNVQLVCVQCIGGSVYWMGYLRSEGRETSRCELTSGAHRFRTRPRKREFLRERVPRVF